MKYISLVSCDYIAGGSRTFHFALCRRFQGKFESHAVCTIKDGAMIRMQVTSALESRRRGIERLARTYLLRSIPQEIPA